MPEQATNQITNVKICLRQGDDEYCNQFNTDYRLLEGEPLFNTDTNILKIGKKDGNGNFITYDNLPSYYLGEGGIKNIEFTSENKIKITRQDNTFIETEEIQTGSGIESISFNNDGTLTIHTTDEDKTSTNSISITSADQITDNIITDIKLNNSLQTRINNKIDNITFPNDTNHNGALKITKNNSSTYTPINNFGNANIYTGGLIQSNKNYIGDSTYQDCALGNYSFIQGNTYTWYTNCSVTIDTDNNNIVNIVPDPNPEQEAINPKDTDPYGGNSNALTATDLNINENSIEGFILYIHNKIGTLNAGYYFYKNEYPGYTVEGDSVTITIASNHKIQIEKDKLLKYTDTSYLANKFSSNTIIFGNIALNNSSYMQGLQNSAIGKYTHAEGYRTVAACEGSHAEGYHTITSPINNLSKKVRGAHAEGVYTLTANNYAHAEGSHTIANGSSSHAEGLYTIANEDYQHVSGVYNADNKNAIAIIGNGTDKEHRSNALEVLKDGSLNAKGINITKTDNFSYSSDPTDWDTQKLSALILKNSFPIEFLIKNIATTKVTFKTGKTSTQDKYLIRYQLKRELPLQQQYGNQLTPYHFKDTGATDINSGEDDENLYTSGLCAQFIPVQSGKTYLLKTTNKITLESEESHGSIVFYSNPTSLSPSTYVIKKNNKAVTEIVFDNNNNFEFEVPTKANYIRWCLNSKYLLKTGETYKNSQGRVLEYQKLNNPEFNITLTLEDNSLPPESNLEPFCFTSDEEDIFNLTDDTNTFEFNVLTGELKCSNGETQIINSHNFIFPNTDDVQLSPLGTFGKDEEFDITYKLDPQSIYDNFESRIAELEQAIRNNS